MLRAKTVLKRWMRALTFSIFSLQSILGIHISLACCSHRIAFYYLVLARPKIHVTVCPLYPQLRGSVLADASRRLTLPLSYTFACFWVTLLFSVIVSRCQNALCSFHSILSQRDMQTEWGRAESITLSFCDDLKLFLWACVSGHLHVSDWRWWLLLLWPNFSL